MNALLEIGTEHLPARFMAPALAQLKTLTENLLTEKRLTCAAVETFGTYRRLVVFIHELAAKSADIQKEVKGPPAKLLKDAAGHFTPQSAGFAQKNGLKPEELVIKETDKGPFIYACVHIPGEKTEKLLPEIFATIVTGLEFAKNMVWEDTGLRYGRPIRSLIGLYGSKLIKFAVAGVPSGRSTYTMLSYGHKPLKVAQADKEAYVKLLREQNPPILVLPQDRREALIKSVSNEAVVRGYQADLDEDLIAETVAFTEHPVAVGGDMDLKALTLPKLLITTVLKQQLKMFPVTDKKGTLQPYFIAVRDGSSENQNEVRDGFKKVMSARLSDAVFFFENDKKEGLETFHSKLQNIQFLEGVGTMADKALRVQKIAIALCEQLGQDTLKDTVSYAALHCYDDLASHVVYEFPELQGYMGGQYAALAAKTDAQQASAKAMEQCYWPLTSSSPLPQTLAGNILSLAGKLDTLAGNFLIGQIPTGSEDPFALRRQAFAIVRILLENNWPLSVAQVLGCVKQAYLPAYKAQWTEALGKQLTDFLFQRLQVVVEQRGHNPTVLKAITCWNQLPLSQAENLAVALAQVQQADEFAALRESAKRVGNILNKTAPVTSAPDAKLFEGTAEKELYETALHIPPCTAVSTEEYLTALHALESFKTPLETFFKDVMVNVPNEKIRTNRLALLSLVRTKLNQTGADIAAL
ncbi:MAG: glycine--tRNA ligase subunit beta [Elusimicrobiaceae bacterium]|nr:glycine--tRNA ligase subunit beta [Elusimicrobiaceae bacterium]